GVVTQPPERAMNKAKLVEEIHKELGTDWTRPQLKRAIDCVFRSVAVGLRSAGQVRVHGFGTFTVRERRARTLKNPQTRAPLAVDASRTVGFRPSPELRKSV